MNPWICKAAAVESRNSHRVVQDWVAKTGGMSSQSNGLDGDFCVLGRGQPCSLDQPLRPFGRKFFIFL